MNIASGSTKNSDLMATLNFMTEMEKLQADQAKKLVKGGGMEKMMEDVDADGEYNTM